MLNQLVLLLATLLLQPAQSDTIKFVEASGCSLADEYMIGTAWSDARKLAEYADRTQGWARYGDLRRRYFGGGKKEENYRLTGKVAGMLSTNVVLY